MNRRLFTSSPLTLCRKSGWIAVALLAFLPSICQNPSAFAHESSHYRNTGDSEALTQLKAYLEENQGEDFDVQDLAKQEFAKAALSKEEAAEAKQLLVDHHDRWVKKYRQQEMEDLVLQIGEHKMPFWFKVYGEKPEGGRSLYISMHGGGGAPKRVNDQQWENQKRLYQPDEGVYVAPRAPVDAWNMWHVGQVDDLYQRLIENMVVFHDVNPDRVYLMGYSAGGDGVYQIAPRWADHLAAAAMMAGHPNETTADGLRNLPFCLQMGGKDGAYDRNKIAADWKVKLEQLQKDDPEGYTHLVKIYPDYGHWMNREDAIAVPWMAKFDRQLYPKKIVWKQDDVTHHRFYWLTNQNPKAKARAVVLRDGQTFRVQSTEGVQSLGLVLDDQAGIDLDQPVIVYDGAGDEKPVVKQVLKRQIDNLATSLWSYGDPKMMVPASVEFEVTGEKSEATEAK